MLAIGLNISIVTLNLKSLLWSQILTDLGKNPNSRYMLVKRNTPKAWAHKAENRRVENNTLGNW